MQTHLSPAIIMRVNEFGESDLLVSFFTPDKGRLKGVAKGARNSQKRFVNCLDIFCHVNLEFGLKKSGNLNYINSGKLIDAYPGLRASYATLSRASYMIELTETLFPLELADSKMFEVLRESLLQLEKGDNAQHLIPIAFEIAAMSLGGYSINFEKCCTCEREYSGQGNAVFIPQKGRIACLNCRSATKITPEMSPETIMAIRALQSYPSIMLDQLHLSEEIIKEIEPVLRLHREYQLGQRLKTANYLS